MISNNIKLNIPGLGYKPQGHGGLGKDAATKMFGAIPSNVFRSQTPALRQFNPNKVVIDHSGTRAGLNYDKGQTLAQMNAMKREMAAMSLQMGSCQPQGAGKFGAMATIAALAPSVMGMLNKLAPKDLNNAKVKDDMKKDNSKSNDTGNDTSVSKNVTSLNNMDNAKDTAALSAAIDAAKVENKDLPQLEANAKRELADLKSQTANLKTTSENTQKDLDDNTKQINEKSQNVNQMKNSVKSCQDMFSADEKAYTDAESAYQNAPETITNTVNGVPTQVPNPQKPILKAQAEQLKLKMEASKQKLETAENNFKTAESELNELKGKTEALKQKNSDAKDAYDKNLTDIKDKQTKIEDLTEQKQKLDKEIPQQEKRLVELQKKEDTELGAIDGNITKLRKAKNTLMNKINVNDVNGLSNKEVKAKEKADAKQSEIDGLNSRKADLLSFKDMRNFSTEVVNGIQFKTGYSCGEKIFAVGGKKVPEAEYTKLMSEFSGQKV